MKTNSFFYCASLLLALGCYSLEIVASVLPMKAPLLVVVIMVKDEEAVIRQTLQMYCKADPNGQYISYFVYDTGQETWSPTMEKAQELFKEYNVTYVIEQEPFIDFSTSRNIALRKAEQHYPNAVFMLMVDAEWYLNDVQGLLKFCFDYAAQEDITKCLIRILSTGLDFYVARLIRAHKNICFEGVVHEAVREDGKGAVLVPPEIYLQYPEKPQGLEKSKRRWLRDRNLLLDEHLKNPADSRTIFYLAQTYDCLNEFESAYHFYLKRTELKGFDEEDYMAHYRLGVLCEKMIPLGTSDWAHALQHYLNAFILRPTRAEPLVRVAGYYINHNIFDLAFMYAYIACQIPYPSDILFVEKELYERIRYEIFAKSAFRIDLQVPKKMCADAQERHAREVPIERYLLSKAFPS